MKIKLILASFSLIFLLFFVCKSDGVNSWEVSKPQKISQLIFFGDSLTAGYGLKDRKESFPDKVAKALDLPFQRFGFSGYTTKDALTKISSLPAGKNNLAVVTLGGNDILGRKPLEETEKNLKEIFTQLQQLGYTVLYTEVLSLFDGKRHDMHLKVCREMKIAMVPDILAGLITDSVLMQADSIHPAEAGCSAIAAKITHIIKENKLTP
jgi:acyl-CoA thioesterase I